MSIPYEHPNDIYQPQMFSTQDVVEHHALI